VLDAINYNLLWLNADQNINNAENQYYMLPITGQINNMLKNNWRTIKNTHPLNTEYRQQQQQQQHK